MAILIGEKRTIWTVDEYDELPEPEAKEATFTQGADYGNGPVYQWRTSVVYYLANPDGTLRGDHVFLSEREALEDCMAMLEAGMKAAQELLAEYRARIEELASPC